MFSTPLYNVLQKHTTEYHPVVQFDPEKDKLLQLDFTSANKTLTPEILADTTAFTEYVFNQLGKKYKYGIGGYNEHRAIYARSEKFDTETAEPRRLHLGVDIWGPVGTPIFAPLGGYVHSFAFNNIYGDYGATIILHHQLDGISFNTLYGHLSIRDIASIKEAQYISRGAEFAHFGEAKENGYWPPHLHFQVIDEMHEKKGDFHGVCRFSEREKYLEHCPNPDLILGMMKYAAKG